MDNIDQNLPHPFFATLWEQAPEGVDAGIYSDGLSTLISMAQMDTDFLGYTIDLNEHGVGVYTCHWKTYEAMNLWLKNGQELLPARLSLQDCLIQTGCLWPWLQQSVA